MGVRSAAEKPWAVNACAYLFWSLCLLTWPYRRWLDSISVKRFARVHKVFVSAGQPWNAAHIQPPTYPVMPQSDPVTAFTNKSVDSEPPRNVTSLPQPAPQGFTPPQPLNVTHGFTPPQPLNIPHGFTSAQALPVPQGSTPPQPVRLLHLADGTPRFVEYPSKTRGEDLL
jgi:hypothetical protein